jgi:spermidine/putrescine transport system ATP-binding protein
VETKIKLPVLQIAGLRKEYGNFVALKDIDLKVEEGEFLTIVGPSGSGKTTLIKLLVGMEDQTEGSIWLRNKRLDLIPANKRPTCMVFQSLALFPHRSVGQNVEFPLKIKGVAAKERKERALELLEMFRLPTSYYDKSIGQCSGGERQRIALARALAFDPEIIFFDEPLSALDYRLRKTLEKELKSLHLRTGKTFIYITHSLEEAMVMSDRIAILKDGRFEQIGPATEIYQKPKTQFVASFMGDVNLFNIDTNGSGDKMEVANFSIADSCIKHFTFSSNKKHVLMVRPESIQILGDDDSTDFMTRGTIDGRFMLGSRVQYEISLDSGKEVVVEAANSSADAIKGDVVKLGFKSEHCHVIEEEL